MKAEFIFTNVIQPISFKVTAQCIFDYISAFCSMHFGICNHFTVTHFIFEHVY